MATKTLSENITQAINDFGTIKTAIVAKGVAVPDGTPTSQYGTKIGDISTGGETPTKGFVPTAWDANGYITEGKWYGTTMPTNIFRNVDISNGSFLNLSNITFENSVTSIGTYAFYFCKSLALTSLPSALTAIPDYSFQNCTNLALTSLPSGLTSIGAYGFYSCTNLLLTSLPSGITSIGDRTFFGCSYINLTTLPTGLSVLPTYAFYRCYAITTIDVYARNLTAAYIFRECTGLTTVNFKNTLLGASYMSSGTFTGCTNLTTINVPWSEGAVTGAPFGAVNATLNYNVT